MPNITPKGKPSWVSTNNESDIDGHVEKQNRVGVGTPNPKEDISAEGISRLQQIVIAAQNSMPFATIRLTFDDTTPDNPTVQMYKAQHATQVANSPTCTRLGDGYAEVQWDASYLDYFGQSGAVNITAAQVTAEGSSITDPVSYEISDSRTVIVYGDTNGSLTLTVWTAGDS